MPPRCWSQPGDNPDRTCNPPEECVCTLVVGLAVAGRLAPVGSPGRRVDHRSPNRERSSATTVKNEIIAAVTREGERHDSATVAPEMRDARPFLSHHPRRRANERAEQNGDDLHVLARWVENLPSHHPDMARIEVTNALDYEDGSLTGGPQSEALIETYATEGTPDREQWLTAYACAVVRFWS